MLSIKRHLTVICLAAALLAPCFVFGQDLVEDEYGLSDTAAETALSSLSISKTTPEEFVAKIVQNVLIFVGTIFFLLTLYAGISWMLAQGSSEKVNKAKGILTTAIIGLIIVAASYAISTFVFSKLAAGGSAWCKRYPEGELVCTPISNTPEAISVCSEGGGEVVYEDCTPQ